jgi:hypothetical protein
MKFIEIFIIVIIIAVGMFGFAFISSSTPPSDIKDTFGKSPTLTTLYVNTTTNSSANITYDTITSYDLVQNITAIETQGSGAGLIIVAACAVLLIIFAMVVLMRGSYSKNKYRT